MSATYYTLPTAVGLAELAGGLAAQVKVPFTHIAIGDGNGSVVTPDGRTALVHEVDRVQITSIRQHAVHANWTILEAAVPEERGGYTIRELAAIGGRVAGQVMAVGNYPETVKAGVESGAASAIILRMVVAFGSAAAIDMSIDPQAYVTLQTVLDQIAAHEAKEDPHPQYRAAATTDKAGIAELATNAETKTGTDAQRVVTPAGLAAVMGDHTDPLKDPHPQYRAAATTDKAGISELATDAEAKAGTDTQRTVTPASLAAVMTDHKDATKDPHPQYLNAQRAASADMNNWAEQFFLATGI